MFEVGQEVWCLIFGKGKIDSMHSGGASYPIQVVFENGEIESYTSEGCILERGNRTLYFSEPEVIGETEPRFIPELKSGTWVIAVNRQTHETSVFDIVQIASIQLDLHVCDLLCILHDLEGERLVLFIERHGVCTGHCNKLVTTQLLHDCVVVLHFVFLNSRYEHEDGC